MPNRSFDGRTGAPGFAVDDRDEDVGEPDDLPDREPAPAVAGGQGVDEPQAPAVLTGEADGTGSWQPPAGVDDGAQQYPPVGHQPQTDRATAMEQRVGHQFIDE